MTERNVKKNTRLPSFLFSLLYLSLVITVAFGLRVAKLNNLPLSLSLDEGTNGLDALQLFRLKWFTPFLQNNFGRETLFFYVQAVALWLYGISFFSLRFASALVATLTMPLVYIVGRRLRLDDLPVYPAKISRHSPLNIISLLAVTGLAVSYWHIYFSRLGLRAILLPPLMLGAIWCFWRGWYKEQGRSRATEQQGNNPSLPPLQFFQKNQPRFWLIIAGMLLGLTCYTYLAARLLPLLFIIFVAIELVKNKSTSKERFVDFSIFSLAAALTATPLALYFYQNPQAVSSRTQAISILATDNPLHTLTVNLTSLLRVHFLSGTWLQEWPTLDLLSALGLLIGLLICLYHLQKPAALFLLLWWLIGTMPVLISKQDWTAPTIPLRGIMAWPALFLISAIGLTSLVRAKDLIISSFLCQNLPVFWPPSEEVNKFSILSWAHKQVSKLRITKPFWPHQLRETVILYALPVLLLIFGGLSSAHNYFSVWATTYNKFSDHPAYMARYLNNQTNQLTLTPLMFYAENVVHFLLQTSYPILTNIDAEGLRSLLKSDQPAVYLLPARSTAESIFVLLAPGANGQGTAYLLPPLTLSQVGALSSHTQTLSPLAIVLDSEQEPIAHVFPLFASASFLPTPLPGNASLQPIQANFNNDVFLTGCQVQPAVVKPGETVTLSLNWQAQRPIDGDYYLFIHLFDISQGQRHGQINTSLKGVLFDAHRWPVSLTVPDTHYFTLPTDVPEGVYRFEVGLYHGASLERLPVTVSPVEPTHTSDDKIILGKFHVWQQPPPPPQYPLEGIQFGDSIALLGIDIGSGLPTAPIQPGQTLTYRLHWQALALIPQNYTVFTHLLDSEGDLQAQQDNAPQQGHYPTSWWDTGEIVLDPYALTLPPGLAPGQYTLRVGLYNPETGQRLPLKNQPQDFVDFPNLITVQ